ncbi:Ubiquitin-conjugating enzyme E2 J2 [Trichinella spiralis]|uniref:Ubiquitin-conjugating enzyme E2 J2 n=1 Tax=Trichinella spiralis TaxID=6334 RepID=A0A0V1B436_TRISP|nr:Ubiquitin-conjugating enzyme E2 J2 [Trichinella spiralis]
MMDDTYERVLLIKPEAFVYRITLPTSSRGHRAATWKLDNPDWVGRLRLLSIGKKVILKLEDKTSGDLFAECPIESYPSPAYESVIDSSRYFVIRLQDPTGRTAQIGLGFADRGDAFDLTVALRDHFRHEEIADEIKKEELAESNKPKLDLGFKEGETITINIGKKTAVNSDMRNRPKSSALQHDTVPILLPPPPGHVQKNSNKKLIQWKSVFQPLYKNRPTIVIENDNRMPGDALRAGARLRKDAARLARDPVPYVKAMPLPSNILEWHYLLQGPEDSPYAGSGFYHGKLIFPSDYPFKPPSIYIITPNGRFKPNTRLCLSISDFHPDTWNPTWSVSTILTGLLSFMLESTPTYGSIVTTDEAKQKLARRSILYNLQSAVVRDLFPEEYETMKMLAGDDALEPIEDDSDDDEMKKLTMQQRSIPNAVMSYTLFACCFVMFIYIARYLMKTVLNNCNLVYLTLKCSQRTDFAIFEANPPPGLLFRIAICKSERVLAPALPIHEKVKFHDPEHHPDFGSLALLYVGNVGSTALVPAGRVQLLLSGQFSDHHSVTITYFRSYVFVATSVCILAVDFGTFPKRFCKTEQFGYSLMDVGVGMFTFANGLVSPVARMRTPKLCKELKNAMLLATIGLARLVFVRWSGYAVNETEYGADWNFFFTLASLKVCILQPRIVHANNIHLFVRFTLQITVELVVVVCVLPVGCTLAVAALLAVGYEFALQFAGLEVYLLEAFSTRRRTFFSLNREGLHSLFGYASLYLVGVHVGRLLFNFRWLPSRRLANASYVIWMCFLCIFDTLSIFVLVFIVQCLYMSIPALCRNQSDVEWNWIFGSCLWTSINKHGLLYFLLSNVITGLVNMTVETKTFNASASLVILVTYSFLSSLPFALPPTGVMLAKC